MLMALICALGMTALAGCGGSNAPSSSSEPADSSSAAAPADSASSASQEASDEELIKADLEAMAGTFVSKDAMMAALQADESVMAFAEMGVDLDSIAENMAKLIRFEVTAVGVTGDTAVAHAAFTMPDFASVTDEAMYAKIEEITAGKDVQSMTEEEQVAMFAEVMTALLSDPNFPTATDELDINYEKENGTWKMADPEGFTQSIETLGSSLAGV